MPQSPTHISTPDETISLLDMVCCTLSQSLLLTPNNGQTVTQSYLTWSSKVGNLQIMQISNPKKEEKVSKAHMMALYILWDTGCSAPIWLGQNITKVTWGASRSKPNEGIRQ